MFVWGDEDSWVPDLATGIPTQANKGISADGMRVTYHLRHKVKWQDGVPFTSEDVAFTVRAIMNRENNVPSRVGYDDILSLQTPDKYTVIVNLRHPLSSFIATFLTEAECVLPAHLLESVPDLNTASFSSRPIGTGPFRVVRYNRGESVELEANDSYWRGAPKLKRIIYSIVPSDSGAVLEIRTHEVDFVHGVSPAAARELIPRNEPPPKGTKIYLTAVNTRVELAFNTHSAIVRDANVRTALSLATNARDIVHKLSNDVNIEAGSDQRPGSFWADPALSKHPYNLASAKKLLDRAGWIQSSDGFRYRRGEPLDIQITAGADRPAIQAIEILLQQQWQAIGIRSHIKNYSVSQLYATYASGGIVRAGKFEVALIGWELGVDPDESALLLCSNIPPRGSNLYRLCDSVIDRSEASGLSSYDERVRRAAYFRVQHEVRSAVPFVVLYYSRSIDVTNSDFMGFKPRHIGSPSWNSWQWSI